MSIRDLVTQVRTRVLTPEQAAEELAHLSWGSWCLGMLSLPRHSIGQAYRATKLVVKMSWAWRGLGPEGRRFMFAIFFLSVVWNTPDVAASTPYREKAEQESYEAVIDVPPPVTVPRIWPVMIAKVTVFGALASGTYELLRAFFPNGGVLALALYFYALVLFRPWK